MDYIDLDTTLFNVTPFVVKASVTGAVDYYLSLEGAVVTDAALGSITVCLIRELKT